MGNCTTLARITPISAALAKAQIAETAAWAAAAAVRVDASGEARRRGYRTTAELLARLSGSSLGAAKGDPQHLALLRLDIAALWRGYNEGDELCEITGLGPIPVETARRLLGDAVLKLIITKGVDVAHVTSLTRGPSQAMHHASLRTSPTCVVEGCSRTIVEYDHRTGAEFKDTHHTRLDEIDRVCGGHRDLHTLQGWALVEGVGKRPMVPPEDPRHPLSRGPTSGDPPTRSWTDSARSALNEALRGAMDARRAAVQPADRGATLFST